MADRHEKSGRKPARVSLLGRFSVRTDLGVFDDSDNRSQKLWSVLVYLLIHRDRPVPREELVETFWKDERSANPGNALKTLLFRIREALEPVFGSDVDPFLARRGSYQWNPEIPCQVDVEELEELCRKAGAKGMKTGDRMELYRQAMELYAGDLLPRLKRRDWAVPLSDKYHRIYLGASAEYAALLDGAGRYEQMEEICRAAAGVDPLDEKAAMLLVRAMLRQGKNLEALEYYGNCTDLRYRELGEGPSAEMQDLYTEIMKVEKGLETDLGAIQRDLKETGGRPGAFYCEYGLFREIYRLEARRAGRSGGTVFIGLITLSYPDGATPDAKTLTPAMEKLKLAAENNLRRGDVVARYSVAQLVFLLPGANRETSCLALERVADAYRRQSRRNELKLTYRTRAVESD